MAALSIDITQGNTERIKVFLAPFYFITNLEREVGRNCSEVIVNDLNSTGTFDVDGKLKSDFGALESGLPSSDLWLTLKGDIFITGSVQESLQDRVKVKVFIWDIATGKQLFGKSLNFTMGSWRRAAHKMSDSIYRRITGESGYFNTKVAYIAETEPGLRRIAVMDQDGANNIYITKPGEFVSTPRFSPDSESIAYMSYVMSQGKIVLYNLRTGSSAIIGNTQGINSSPTFAPNGKTILLAESVNGKTNIYSLDLRNKKSTRLTKDGSTNISASYSPDSKFIVFNSDRDGGQQLYVMNADGTNQHRISSGIGKYTNPVWSPRGDWIAFIKVRSGSYYLGVMKPDGQGERLLVKGYMIDSPSWSPNGRVILFTEQDHPSAKDPIGSRLVTVDLTGGNKRTLYTPTDASNSHWSAVLLE